MSAPVVPPAEHVAASVLQGGDIVVLPLAHGDEICTIRRAIHPGGSQVVLIDYSLASGATGHTNLLGTDAVLRVRENPARRAA